MRAVKPRAYRRWSIDQKRYVINEYETTDISIEDLCHKHRIYVPQFYQWKKHIDEAIYKAGKNKKKIVIAPPQENNLMARAQYLLDELKAVILLMVKK